MNKMAVSLRINASIKDFDFSFDEVLLELVKMFNKGGIVKVVELIFNWISIILAQNFESLILPNLEKCCSNPSFNKHGYTSKTMKTTLGKIKVTPQRLRCKHCGKSVNPFNEFFQLKNRTWSYEFEKLALETIKDQSYRRSSKQLEATGLISASKNQIFRMVRKSDFKKQNVVVDQDLKALMADGTGYKPWHEDSKKELKIVLGVNNFDQLVPIGAWIRSSWKQIGRELYKRNRKTKKLAPKKLATVLVSDGDERLIKGLKKLTHHQQRCQWHVARNFKYPFQYQDKGSKEDARVYTNQIWELLNSTNFNKIQFDEDMSIDERKLKVMEEVWKAEKEINELEVTLKKDKFSKAATYLKNAKEQLFTNVRYLIKTGEELPKVTSRIERFMRELARRMKRIAHNWSEDGPPQT